MFTGLVEEVGAIGAIERSEAGSRLRIECALASELQEGDSVAVNGVCLTATGTDPNHFDADVMNATLERTSLGGLEQGAAVNLERAVRASDRLGGHIVQGHIDGVADLVEVREDGMARRLVVDLPADLRRFVVAQGSVALEGVSLTVTRLTEGGLEVSLIPETQQRTTLGGAEAGARLNLEVDIVARYVERLIRGHSGEGTADQ